MGPRVRVAVGVRSDDDAQRTATRLGGGIGAAWRPGGWDLGGGLVALREAWSQDGEAVAVVWLPLAVADGGYRWALSDSVDLRLGGIVDVPLRQVELALSSGELAERGYVGGGLQLGIEVGR